MKQFTSVTCKSRLHAILHEDRALTGYTRKGPLVIDFCNSFDKLFILPDEVAHWRKDAVVIHHDFKA